MTTINTNTIIINDPSEQYLAGFLVRLGAALPDRARNKYINKQTTSYTIYMCIYIYTYICIYIYVYDVYIVYVCNIYIYIYTST